MKEDVINISFRHNQIINELGRHRHGIRAIDLAKKYGYNEVYLRTKVLKSLRRQGLVVSVKNKGYTYYAMAKKDIQITNDQGDTLFDKPAELPFDKLRNGDLVKKFEELYKDLEGIPMYSLEQNVDRRIIDSWLTRIIGVLGAPKITKRIYSKKKKEIENKEEALKVFIKNTRGQIQSLWITHVEFRFHHNIEDDIRKRYSFYMTHLNRICESLHTRIQYMRKKGIQMNEDDSVAGVELFKFVLTSYSSWLKFYQEISTICKFSKYFDEIANLLQKNGNNNEEKHTNSGKYGKFNADEFSNKRREDSINSTLTRIINGDL